MRDGLPDEAHADAAPRRPSLIYPFDQRPEPGEAIEVADGVLWLRLPLPFALDHINVWALRDGEGWTVVDTGVASSACKDAWRAALAGPLQGRPVARVLCTHMHPDHVGLAGWLTKKFDCRLWMTRLEYMICRVLVADTGREAPEEGVRFYRACGWSDDQLEGYRTRFGGFGKGVHPLPDGYRRIEDGDQVDIDGRAWRIVVGDGHSPEHACLWRAEDGVLISGDQVLPKISSNVSVWPTEPEADPLSDWLASLAKLKREIPADALVLPSHGDPFRGLHDRLDGLTRGHERSLERLQRMLKEPKRATDVFGALFARAIGDDMLGMATGESVAHLNCLERRGRAVRELDENGVLWWRAA
ncbi:MBL fold metallo-hydrolase [Caulobacter sp. 17J65-9]|uniref:MBL fold metallo-hydrolase n=1 Tax=Caulobacter sp. 17J65-9 TaxID=2709382 RepID=UPI0013CCDFE9|nr:MBL fold metallo-hydrolase [Caulobacter sp. 17J65-9]